MSDNKSKQTLVFKNQNGQYGADQGRLFWLWEHGSERQKQEIKVWLEKLVGKELSDTYVYFYLKKLYQEGCGYAAAVDVLLHRYQDNPERFEELYHLPYMAKYGRVNFDEVLLNFYHEQDDLRKIPFIQAQIKVPYPGVRAGDLRYNLEEFTRARGELIKGKRLVYWYEDLLRRYLNQGHLIVMTSYIEGMSLLAPDNASYSNYRIRFHSVVLTGYDIEKGKFTVSSWGKKYYLRFLPMTAIMFVY